MHELPRHAHHGAAALHRSLLYFALRRAPHPAGKCLLAALLPLQEVPGPCTAAVQLYSCSTVAVNDAHVSTRGMSPSGQPPLTTQCLLSLHSALNWLSGPLLMCAPARAYVCVYAFMGNCLGIC